MSRLLEAIENVASLDDWAAMVANVYYWEGRPDVIKAFSAKFHSLLAESADGVQITPFPDWVRFSVTDQGPGLNPDDLKHLFEKFRKLSAKPTGGELSTGLGLSIVKKLTELHQATVWAESVPGSGATFHVEFPRHFPMD